MNKRIIRVYLRTDSMYYLLETKSSVLFITEHTMGTEKNIKGKWPRVGVVHGLI